MFEPKTKEEYAYVRNARPLVKIFTGMDHIVYQGLENLVVEGPNIISANHPDVGKGIGGIIKLLLEEAGRKGDIISRKELFSKEEFKQLIATYANKNIARRMLRLVLTPLEIFMENYLPPAMKSSGMIPIEISNCNSVQSTKYNLRVISDIIEPKLLDGRAIVLFQYNFNKTSSPYHHYLLCFHQTPARIAMHAYIHSGMLVPITTISIHGAKGILPLKKTIINVGEPLYITDFLEEQNPLRALTDALEKRTAELLEESGLRDDPKKHKNDERYMSKTS
jgi:hypothetical protein